MIRNVLLLSTVVVTSLFAAYRTRHASASLPAYEIRFDQQLGLQNGLKLAGGSVSQAVAFYCESGLRPVSGSELHIFLDHSPELDADRSFFSVSLNYGVLRSVRLDDQTRSLTEIVIPLPPSLLKQENRLVFSVDQWPKPGASSGAAWTAIGARSYIVIRYQQQQVAGDLGLLPAPLIDPYSYRPKVFDVLLPEQVSTKTLEATASLVANFTRRLAPDPVAINVAHSLASARNPLLIVGTPREQPSLREVETHPVAAADGLAGIVNRSGLPIVFVTGGSPEGVLKAARRLVLGQRAPTGNLLRVQQDTIRKAGKLRDWKGFIPPVSRFTLADLNFKDLGINSQNDFQLTIPLNATPDARFLSYGSQMTLWFQLPPDFAAAHCSLLIDWNGTQLSEAPPSELAKGSPLAQTLSIPGRLLRMQNQLRVSLRGPVQNLGAQTSGWLLNNSHFYLPHDYRAELPDLRLLQYHLYPFSLLSDLSDTVILLPNSVDRGLFRALVQLAGEIGRYAPGKRLDFRVRRLADFAPGEHAESNVIYLHSRPAGPPPERLFPFWPPLPKRESHLATAVVREIASPWDSRKFILSIGAGSDDAVGPLIESLFDRSTLAQLSGDTAYLNGDGIACYRSTSPERVEQSSYLTHLEAWLRANWLALPAILAAASLVLFAGLRLLLDRYKSSRSAP